MRRVILVTLLLAGCASPAPEGPVVPSVNVTEERPETTFGDVAVGPAAAPDVAATLDAPPTLVPGEWWRVRFESPYTEPTEFLRVVARVEPDGTAVVGMPHDGWWKEAVIFHTPSLGEVAPDGAYAAHDVPFVPLQFPLEEGATWETAWESEDATLTATVEAVDGTAVDVAFVGVACGITAFLGTCQGGESEQIRLRYDAAMHTITRFEGPGMTWEVLEHGYGFEGWVTIPRAEDLVFLHGRFGPALDLAGQPAPFPTDSVEVAGGYNRVSFILGAGGVAAGEGVFRETATAPDGTSYELEKLPGAGPYEALFLEHASPDGAWTFEHLNGGAGLVMAEGVAYHQYDIQVPSAALRTDHAHDVVR